jgi:quinol monooxygenase YgiN
MTKIGIHARARIHDGKLQDFKGVAERCVAIVRAKDPGTLLYDWYLSADEKECLARETYASSEAMLAHMANVGAELQAMMAVSDVEIDVFGEPTDELAKALSGLPARMYSTLEIL